MKYYSLNLLNLILKNSYKLTLLILPLVFAGCDPDDPQKENVPELITKVTLTFTPSGGGSSVAVTASDPDGMGIQPIQVDGPINLSSNATYTLAIALINELADVSDPAYNVTEEVAEEGDEHIFFFAWTNNVFSDPAGNGNMDNRQDDVNYQDEDDNGLPIGLSTTWTAADVDVSGTFNIVLKHQPDLKSEASGSSTGETDLDIEFEINVQ